MITAGFLLRKDGQNEEYPWS